MHIHIYIFTLKGMWIGCEWINLHRNFAFAKFCEINLAFAGNLTCINACNSRHTVCISTYIYIHTYKNKQMSADKGDTPSLNLPLLLSRWILTAFSKQALTEENFQLTAYTAHLSYACTTRAKRMSYFPLLLLPSPLLAACFGPRIAFRSVGRVVGQQAIKFYSPSVVLFLH